MNLNRQELVSEFQDICGERQNRINHQKEPITKRCDFVVPSHNKDTCCQSKQHQPQRKTEDIQEGK